MAPEHLYCPRCGARRKISTLQPRPTDPARSRTRWLPYLFGAGAVFWLIELTQFAAVVAAPAGRDQLIQALVGAGVKRDLMTVLVVECVIIIAFEIGAVALHACAFYGLRRFRPWGWVAAVITSVAWSLVLIGIPVLVFLLQRPTREAYGIS
jgi:hypothetical protein